METAPQRLALEGGYSSTDLARLAGLTFRQLDYYDRLGILSPSRRRARGSGSRRRYSKADLGRARFVAALRGLGAPTPVIARALGQLVPEPAAWPPIVYISPTGELADSIPDGPAWWTIGTVRLLHPDLVAA